MNKGLWIARKNYLCLLIRKVSDLHGGDEIEFLRQVCREVLAAYPEEKIEEAIRCYEEVEERLMFGVTKTQKLQPGESGKIGSHAGQPQNPGLSGKDGLSSSS